MGSLTVLRVPLFLRWTRALQHRRLLYSFLCWFDVSLWLASGDSGVMSFMAEPLELLTGVLVGLITKAAPFDPLSLLVEIRALPFCIL